MGVCIWCFTSDAGDDSKARMSATYTPAQPAPEKITAAFAAAV